ncbi:MAG: hypothetical protein HYY06_14630 [Deltaproteobacteria bacterium]|nr:hypothetical protein [Deltaproteobacteria bacterium]
MEPVDPAAQTRAILNIVEDLGEERARLEDTQTAILNVLDDAAGEREELHSTQVAILNVLEDSAGERERLGANQAAILNILGDFGEEKVRLEDAQKALLNILEDVDVERARVKEAAAELARSNADLEQFAYVASHDLQEPLRMVSAYVQLLERRYEGRLDEQADKYIHYAVDGARRMEALIGALLEYSRAGRGELRAVPVDTARVLEDVLVSLSAAIEESQTVITHERLPVVRSDEAQLSMVLQNLIANALKFRRPGEPVRVHVSAERRADAWVFAVRDNGIGIDPAYQDRVFVIFQRLHTRAEYPGTGIGLAICKKVVERLGGRIWFESKPGDGTTFFFTLPATEGESATRGRPGAGES